MYSRIAWWLLIYLLFVYLLFVVLPYLVAKKLEPIIYNQLSPEIKKELNERVKKFPRISTISEKTNCGLDYRGGAAPIVLWLIKVFVMDFAPKVGLSGLVSSTIFNNTTDKAAENLIKYFLSITAASGNKFKRLANRLKNINPPAD